MDFGKTATVRALGRDWTLSRLELEYVFAFRDFCREREGDPFRHVDRLLKYDLADKTEALALVKAAQETARQLDQFSLATDVAKRWLATEEGAALFYCNLLKPAHPDMTPALAFRIIQDAGQEQLERAMTTITGRAAGNGEAPARPKLKPGAARLTGPLSSSGSSAGGAGSAGPKSSA